MVKEVGHEGVASSCWRTGATLLLDKERVARRSRMRNALLPQQAARPLNSMTSSGRLKISCAPTD